MFETVNIMATIMFEAQRHGRHSFYMVSAGDERSQKRSADVTQEFVVVGVQAA